MPDTEQGVARRWLPFLLLAALLICCGLLLVVARFNAPPEDFPSEAVFHIEQGTGASTIASELAAKALLRSPRLLQVYLRILNADQNLVPGDYRFSKRIGALAVALRISRGEFGLTPLKVTIPEGSTVSEVADILQKSMPLFGRTTFLTLAAPEEGYLFPETYFFSPLEKPQAMARRMRTTFDQMFAPLGIALEASKRSKAEIVIMASLLEKEAQTPEDRARVAGILWKRIGLGMPLQVDAPFLYLLHKTSHELTQADLAFDSPYNTYLYRGLPKGPIGNPGLEAMRAALFPETSPYLYYLSDKKGTLHYAVDLDGHKKNRALYLH